MFGNKDKFGWNDRLASMSREKLAKVLDRAVRLIINPEANTAEKEGDILRLQAALAIDPKLVFDVISSVHASEAPNSDIENLKQAAAEVQSNFDGLVNATQTLRVSLTEIGAIRQDSRLPETVEQWQLVIDRLLQGQTRQLAAREAFLSERQKELETKREGILAEINAAQKLFQPDMPTLSSKATKVMSQIKSEMTDLFQQEVTEMVAHAIQDIQDRLIKRFASLIDQTTADIIDAKEMITNLSVNSDQYYKTGQMIVGKGVYTGVWQPKDRSGKYLGQMYNVFAAPEDLTGSSGTKMLFTFKEAASEIANKEDWHHHDGFVVPDQAVYTGYDTYLYRALNNGQYSGQWIIPTREILCGLDADDIRVQEDSLVDQQNVGDFAGTFMAEGSEGNSRWYWSSTEHGDGENRVYSVRFTDHEVGRDRKDNFHFSCRPVRLEKLVS